MSILRSSGPMQHWPSEGSRQSRWANARRRSPKSSRFDVACEALLLVGYASRRHHSDMAARALSRALSLSEEYQLSVWQVRALAELGILDQDADSDPTRFHQARERATAAGMVGMLAAIDLHIGETIEMRSGPVAAYPTFLAADTQARQLQLMGLHAHIRVHIAECLLNADGRPLPGRVGPAAPAEVDDMIAEAIALGEKSKPIPWAKLFLGNACLVPRRQHFRHRLVRQKLALSTR